jgi:hypothetical protein
VGPIDIMVKSPLAKELRIQVFEKPVTALNYDPNKERALDFGQPQP